MIDLIGTPRFPLSGKIKEKRVFGPGHGKPIEDEALAALVRTIHKKTPFKLGTCYTNTEKICQNGWANGWIHRLKPFAGWIVFGRSQEYPIHHSWVVLDDELVIDMGQLKLWTVLAEQHLAVWDERRKTWQGSPFDLGIALREEWCRLIFPYEQGDVIENRIWGQIPTGMTYVGCPCMWDDASRTFALWHKRWGVASRYEGPGEMSPTQFISQLISEGKTSEEILKIFKETYRG